MIDQREHRDRSIVLASRGHACSIDQPASSHAVYTVMGQQEHQGWSPRARRVRPVRGHHPSAPAARPGRIFSHAELTIHRVRDGDREVVAVCGRLDLWSAWEFERELRRVEASDVREILVDLAGLQFIDPAGMEVVSNAGARSRHHSKRLMIHAGDEALQRMFGRSGLLSQLPFVDGEMPARLS